MRKKGKIEMMIAIGIACFLLVMIMFMQLKIVYETDITSIETMREEELREQLANWKLKYEEVEEQYSEISETLNKYKEESSSDAQTRENLEEELEKIQLILGLTDVKGQGIAIELEEGEETEGKIKADELMIIVNYLKNAGAEAIEINGQRIVNSTFFVDIGRYSSYMKINGQRVTAPYTIYAIGEPDYLKSALVGKGGYAEKITNWGQKINIETIRRITISKYDGDDLNTKYIEDK